MDVDKYNKLSQRKQAYLAVRLLHRRGEFGPPRRLTSEEVNAITSSDVSSWKSRAK